MLWKNMKTFLKLKLMSFYQINQFSFWWWIFLSFMRFYQTYTISLHQSYVIKRVKIHPSDKFSSQLWVFIKLMIFKDLCISLAELSSITLITFYHINRFSSNWSSFITVMKFNNIDVFSLLWWISPKWGNLLK